MRDVLKQLILLTKELPVFIEEYLNDCVINLQSNDIKSTSLYKDEIWLI